MKIENKFKRREYKQIFINMNILLKKNFIYK